MSMSVRLSPDVSVKWNFHLRYLSNYVKVRKTFLIYVTRSAAEDLCFFNLTTKQTNGTMAPPPSPHPDPYGDKMDMCLTDGIVKMGGGMLLGTVASILFLGRRRWPIIAGIGVGMGLAYANCEAELNTTIKKNRS